MKTTNQQESLTIASWIVGFVDGEGSFLVSIFRNNTTKRKWQIFPEFIITQGKKSLNALSMIKKYFGCGQIYVNQRNDNHHENIYRYCVRSIVDLNAKIIPFFHKYKLQTAKAKDYKKFADVVCMMVKKKHLEDRIFNKIQKISQSMNRKGIKQ